MKIKEGAYIRFMENKTKYNMGLRKHPRVRVVIMIFRLVPLGTVVNSVTKAQIGRAHV